MTSLEHFISVPVINSGHGQWLLADYRLGGPPCTNSPFGTSGMDHHNYHRAI